jgi:hypothetical protein
MEKKLRRIVVDGRQFGWILPGNSLEFGEVHISVFADKRTQALRIDRYPWGFEVRPRSIAAAIRFALSNGWSPHEPGPAFYVSFRDDKFVVLPPGIAFLHNLPEESSSERKVER